MELNRALTELERSYDDSRAEMHLDAGRTLRRVVDTALDASTTSRRSARSMAAPTARSSRSRRSTAAGRPRCAVWTPGSNPGVLRPITFDPRCWPRDGSDLVYVHLGHPIVQKGRSDCCAARCSAWTAPLDRVTAVVVEDLPAVVRGRGDPAGAGRARRPAAARGGVPHRHPAAGRRAMAEEKAEEVLDHAARRASDLILAEPATSATSSWTCGTLTARRCAPGC